MRILHLEPGIRFHVRCAMFIALGAALATLVGAGVLSMERINQIEDTQRGFQSEAYRLQQQLNRRMAEAETREQSASADVETRLRDIIERQETGVPDTGTPARLSPFPVEKVLASVVELICIDNADRETYYTGSGTVIDGTGLVITNRHLLMSGDKTLIRYCGIGFTRDPKLPPKIEFVGSAVAVQESSDLALLQVTERLDGKPLPAKFASIPLAEARAASVALRLGDPIYVGGYPGLGADTFTFTQGVVSGRVGTDLIKTSALIDSGTSGGAAFDSSGRYVGVPTAAVKGEIGGSLGYLVGANAIDDFMKAYAKGGHKLPADDAAVEP